MKPRVFCRTNAGREGVDKLPTTAWTVVFWTVLLLTVFAAGPLASAATRFSPQTTEKQPPSPLEFDRIWFYDKQMNRVIPDIDPGWIVAVFRREAVPALETGGVAVLEDFIRRTALEIVIGNEGITDYFYDPDLAEDACFFKLATPAPEAAIEELIAEFNHDGRIGYAHPLVRLEDKTYAFFNAFDMEWKKSADPSTRQELLERARALEDRQNGVYRVDIFSAPFFDSVNLLAEDVNTVWCSPILVELKPSVKAVLKTAINGFDIGDKIPFELRIDFADRIRVEPSSIADIRLKPDNLQSELFEIRFDPYDHVAAAAKSPVIIRGDFRIYSPGEFAIPPVKIRFSCPECSNESVRSLETAPVAVKSSSRIPRKGEKPRLIVDDGGVDLAGKLESRAADMERRAGKNLTGGLSALFASLVFFMLALLALSRRKDDSDKGRESERLRESTEALETLLKSTPRKPHWVYMVEAGRLLRQFLATRYDFENAPGGGSGDVYFDAIRHFLPGGIAGDVEHVLKSVDEAAALESETVPDLDRFRDYAARVSKT